MQNDNHCLQTIPLFETFPGAVSFLLLPPVSYLNLSHATPVFCFYMCVYVCMVLEYRFAYILYT